MDDLDDDLDPPKRRGSAMAVVLPLITAGLALAVGGAIGALGVALWWRATPPEVQTVVQLRDLTDEELETMCNPFLTDTLSVLTEAQAKVVDLESQVKQKEAVVAELERKAAAGAVAGRKLRAELEAARAELVTLRAELERAVTEKEQALAELDRTVETLRQTEEVLEETKTKLTIAEGDVLTNRWRAFAREAQLEICERGGRRKMGRCREAVQTALGAEIEGAYRHCLKSGQAVPGLREATKDLPGLPDFARWLDEDERTLKGWYIVLCDPTLPEAPDFADALKRVQGAEAAGAAAGAAAESAGSAIDRALRELEDLDD